MNTRRISARRLDKEIANAGSPPRGNQVPHLEGVANYDKALVNPPSLKDGDIRATFLQMDKDITNKAQPFTTYAQTTTQANWEVLSQANQHVGTMASCLRYFARMNPPTFYGSKVEENPQKFIN